MKDLTNLPLFGILISLLAFEIGLFINKKSRIAIFNPLLISILIIIVFLKKFNISLDSYNKGGNTISFFLAPATVILAVPLYKQLDILKANLLPIIVGITVGCITAITSIYLFSRLFGMNAELCASLIPKSVTTPIGVEISKQIGGIPAITVAAIVITGIIGAVFGPTICRLFGIKNKVAIGISIGTSSHALGTTKAIQLGETEGAMSSLAIGIAGLLTVFFAPLLLKLLSML